jgi:hypothetical protein
VGGLVVSQLLTLYITPVTYIYMDSFGRWLSQRRWLPAWRRAQSLPAVHPPTA